VGISFSAGSLTGLLAGGALAVVDWRLTFLANVPFGVLNALWSYKVMYRVSPGTGKVVVDWVGAAVLATALFLLLMGLALSTVPYDGHALGWSAPYVWAMRAGGAALIAALIPLERRTRTPMLRLDLFSTTILFGVFSAFLLFLAQGANVFVLSIFLQAVYSPWAACPTS
jgi:hypothetical protein